jgi:hypothetical protein
VPSRSALARILAPAVALQIACATAQRRPAESIEVATDQRVRVTLSSRVATGPLQGLVVAVSPDSLVVAREEGGVRRLSRSQVDRVEVSVERVRDPLGAAGEGVLLTLPWIIVGLPVITLLATNETEALLLYVVAPVVGVATIAAVLGGGPQDVWVEASWLESASPTPTDTLHAEDP